MAKNKVHTRVAASEQKLVPTEGEDVFMSEEHSVYLVDVSGSMKQRMAPTASMEDDIEAGMDDDTVLKRSMSKRAAVAYALRTMFVARQGYATADQLSVVTFGGAVREYAEVVAPLAPIGTSHFESIRRIGASQGTPMFQGFQLAAKVLKNVEGLVRIVLLSDGEPNCNYTKNDVADLVHEMFEDHGFVTDVLGIGIPGLTSEYDEYFLKRVAKNGGGEFYPVESVDELVKRLGMMVIERRALIGSGIKLLSQVS